MKSARGRGLYDVGLNEGAAASLRDRGEDPAAWTVVELCDSRGRTMCITVMRKDDVAAPDTVRAFFTWLAARDEFLRAM
jgi:hypothetical protein